MWLLLSKPDQTTALSPGFQPGTASAIALQTAACTGLWGRDSPSEQTSAQGCGPSRACCHQVVGWCQHWFLLAYDCQFGVLTQCFAVAGGWTQSLPTPTVLWVSPKMNSLFLLCSMIFLRAARKTCTATSDLILQETVIIVYSRLEVFVLYRLLGFPFLCHSTWVHKLLWVQLSKAKVKTCARNSKLFTVSNNAISSVIWNDRILLG